MLSSEQFDLCRNPCLKDAMMQDFLDLTALTRLVHKAVDCHTSLWNHLFEVECKVFLDQRQTTYYLAPCSKPPLPLSHLRFRFFHRLACVEKIYMHQCKLACLLLK